MVMLSIAVMVFSSALAITTTLGFAASRSISMDRYVKRTLERPCQPTPDANHRGQPERPAMIIVNNRFVHLLMQRQQWRCFGQSWLAENQLG